MAEASARTEERFAIARELHDMVGHYVTGIVVQAQAARHVAERQPAAAAVALERIERAGADAMVAMRRMVGGLRDDPSSSSTAPRATWDEIDDLVANAVERGEPVLATIDPAVRGTAQSLASSVHRIIAESLTNVRRHAREVTLVEVAILQCADSLVVTVRDDGLVAAALGRDTFGIIGMRERAVSLGGSLFAGPAPGGGWLVHAELPMEAHR
jgi:signal transduction histidine kinase